MIGFWDIPFAVKKTFDDNFEEIKKLSLELSLTEISYWGSKGLSKWNLGQDLYIVHGLVPVPLSFTTKVWKIIEEKFFDRKQYKRDLNCLDYIGTLFTSAFIRHGFFINAVQTEEAFELVLNQEKALFLQLWENLRAFIEERMGDSNAVPPETVGVSRDATGFGFALVIEAEGAVSLIDERCVLHFDEVKEFYEKTSSAIYLKNNQLH